MFSSNSTTGRRYSLWHFGSHFFSQAGSQAATLSQALTGQQALHAFSQQRALWQHFLALQAFSQPQAFSHAGSQAFGQAFSQQAGSGQQPLAALQAPVSHTVPFDSNRSFKPANKSRTGVARHFLQWPQVAFSQQATFPQVAGSGQHAFGHAFSQQATLAQALHSPQPPPFSPSKPFRSSKPNPWLHRATLTRSAPKIVLLLIELQLLYSELGFEEGGSLTRSSYGVLRQGRRAIPWLDYLPDPVA
jgi:hypothetical protein